MDVIKRKVYTYGGYTEQWSEDYRLTVCYERPREYELSLVDGVWSCDLELNPLMLSYLRSSAAIAYAGELCDGYSLPLDKIGCFLTVTHELLPAELFRYLMDDRGFSMEASLTVVIDVFGKALCNMPENDWLYDMQPRTAAVSKLLIKLISEKSIIIHEPYSEEFRSPAGAVEEATGILLSVCAPGCTDWVTMHVWAEDFCTEIPMERKDNGFYCRFTPPKPAVYFYSFFHRDGETRSFQLTAFKKGFETPDWFKGGIMYQVFPDRFGIGEDVRHGMEYHRALGQTPELHSSTAEPVKWQARAGEKDYAPDDFYGGTLKGITEKLPYIKSLGVSVLYLNPISEARSNHRYDTSDYEKVDPILGCNQDYVNLCSKASELGIRIINDGVFSHTGADSRYFNRYGHYGEGGASRGESSPYYAWYDFKKFPDDYRCWWGFKDLPEVNEENPAWQDYVVSGNDSIVKKWLRLGASGWRLDVADELPDDVLCLIRKASKEEKSDALILGEVWEDAILKQEQGRRRQYALGDALDTVMNYPFREAVLDFALGKISSFELRDFFLHQRFNYPYPMYVSLMNLLSSHDVERLHTYLALGGDCKNMNRTEQSALCFDEKTSEKATKLQMLCAAIQYCVPGVPCLYYGDEECLDGGRDPFNRAPFEPQEKKLYGYYKKLGQVRNGSDALKHGDISVKTPSPDVIIIVREAGKNKAVCLVNRGAEQVEYSLGTPVLTGSRTIPPLSAEIFIE